MLRHKIVKDYWLKYLITCNNILEVTIVAKYFKNPIPVEAIEYRYGLEDGFDDLEVAIKSGLDIQNYVSPVNSDKVPFVTTLEGKHFISKGDYIITGVDGERYPCKKSIFLKTYSLLSS